MRRKVAIALGGGGAKFFAHLGMLQVLKENGIKVDYLSCSSMGAIAGVLFANDVDIDDVKDEFYKFRRIVAWFRPSFKKFGFLSQSAVTKILDDLLPQKKIENSKIKFSVTSANILDGKMHLFEKGDILTAVRASCAFPGIFPPVKYKGKLLVDGGVLNNIPADICRKFVGKRGVVISSSLDAELKCKMSSIQTPFDIYQRILYLPMYEKRLRIIDENSDFFFRHFAHKTLNLKSGQDIFKVLSKRDLELFYEVGRKTTLKDIDKIRERVCS